MKQPIVSIIMPIHNVENYLEESIKSILAQTYKDFEFIIINDGSTDSSADIIKSIQDNRILYIESKENKGNYVCRNVGCKLARGKYICVMDGDDIAISDRIEKQISVLEENKSILACGSYFQFIGENIGERSGICVKPQSYSFIKMSLLRNNVFLHPSLMIRKRTLESVGYYNENYCYSSDYDLVCSLSLKGEVINIPDVLMKYRMHPKQISSSRNIEQIKFANIIRLCYLKKLGFRLTQKEKQIFTLLMTKPDTAINKSADILSIVEKIKNQNLKLACFNSDSFNLFWEYITITH